MKKKARNGICGLCFCLLICLPVILLLALGEALSTPTQYYETTEISDYGIYGGNVNNSFPTEFIGSFFPEEILDSYVDVEYSYRAENSDTYGFEAYLEFVIEDTDEFQSHISSIAANEEWNKFAFDNSFMEYSIVNVLDMELSSKNDYANEYDVPIYSIGRAEIGKVLYSESEQRVIYVAIGVYDGGAATTAFLCKFFERFEIDPLDYIKTAESAYVNTSRT